MAARNQAGKNQTKDLKCATHLLSDKFRNMSEEKKTIVRDLGFGGLMHIPPLRVHHKVLRELANNFKLGENRMANNFLEITYPFSSGCIFSDERNMAVSKHPNREFISPKTNKEFRVEDYPMFIPFIDAKKLTSHRYVSHWWLWVIDTTKRRFYILDPLHKKAPSNERKQLNKFTNESICRRGTSEEKGMSWKLKQHTYDCAVYVMKWLELIEPENIKRAKYEWDNWPQDEVDHYRVEYASRILFSEMNKERDQAIRASNAIRLSKPSSVLLSPFCQINSTDIETE
ncbi:uncharacterized protein DS421_15g500360 [Arachis hypogaea]|nr:uncharacterized protein DS421_15g500360 [Arachis hypogaea]